MSFPSPHSVNITAQLPTGCKPLLTCIAWNKIAFFSIITSVTQGHLQLLISNFPSASKQQSRCIVLMTFGICLNAPHPARQSRINRRSSFHTASINNTDLTTLNKTTTFTEARNVHIKGKLNIISNSVNLELVWWTSLLLNFTCIFDEQFILNQQEERTW